MSRKIKLIVWFWGLKLLLFQHYFKVPINWDYLQKTTPHKTLDTIITEIGKPVISRCNHSFGNFTDIKWISENFRLPRLTSLVPFLHISQSWQFHELDYLWIMPGVADKEQISLINLFFNFLKLNFIHWLRFYQIGAHNISSFDRGHIINHLCQIRSHTEQNIWICKYYPSSSIIPFSVSSTLSD